MEDTRVIIPVEVEQAERDKAEQRDEVKDFIASFTLDSLPACPIGMRLLLDFAKASPNSYEFVRRANFMNVTGPGSKHPQWLKYVEHFATCPDCNEDGSPPILYSGRIVRK